MLLPWLQEWSHSASCVWWHNLQNNKDISCLYHTAQMHCVWFAWVWSCLCLCMSGYMIPLFTITFFWNSDNSILLYNLMVRNTVCLYFSKGTVEIYLWVAGHINGSWDMYSSLWSPCQPPECLVLRLALHQLNSFYILQYAAGNSILSHFKATWKSTCDASQALK